MESAVKTSTKRTIAPSPIRVVVTGLRGGLVTMRYFHDKERARDFFTDCLAKYLDYNVELENLCEDAFGPKQVKQRRADLRSQARKRTHNRQYEVTSSL